MRQPLMSAYSARPVPVSIGFGSWVLLALVVSAVAGLTSIGTVFVLRSMASDMPGMRQSQAQAFIGVWRIDIERTFAPMLDEMDPEERDAMRRSILRNVGEGLLEVDEKAVHMRSSAELVRHRSYRVIKEAEDHMELEVMRENGLSPEKITIRVEGDLLMIEPEGPGPGGLTVQYYDRVR